MSGIQQMDQTVQHDEYAECDLQSETYLVRLAGMSAAGESRRNRRVRFTPGLSTLSALLDLQSSSIPDAYGHDWTVQLGPLARDLPEIARPYGAGDVAVRIARLTHGHLPAGPGPGCHERFAGPVVARVSTLKVRRHTPCTVRGPRRQHPAIPLVKPPGLQAALQTQAPLGFQRVGQCSPMCFCLRCKLQKYRAGLYVDRIAHSRELLLDKGVLEIPGDRERL